MRAVVQRVSRARVTVEGEEVGRIGRGLLVLLGVGEGDTERDAEYLAGKVVGLRIFPDEARLMNLSVLDVAGEVLAISQFTLYGDCRKGKRPSFVKAMKPPRAEELFNLFVERLAGHGLRVATGRFGAMMDVELVNQGPVTILLDSSKLF